MLEVVLIVARGRGEGAGKPQPDGVYSVAAAGFRRAVSARRAADSHGSYGASARHIRAGTGLHPGPPAPGRVGRLITRVYTVSDLTVLGPRDRA